MSAAQANAFRLRATTISICILVLELKHPTSTTWEVRTPTPPKPVRGKDISANKDVSRVRFGLTGSCPKSGVVSYEVTPR